MDGKKIGSWLGGNEPELFAGLTKAGLDPTKENVIKQNFDMSGLLKGDLDVAQAMIYNEYAQVLEAKNPTTGALYTPADLNVVDFNDPAVGTAMLQDQVFASDKWLKTGNNADIATKFLQATFKGWIYCRDNPQKCVDIVLAKGSQLGASHQAWQMNEINALIWPSPNGIGLLDKTLYDQTIKIATTYKVLKAAPSGGRDPDRPRPEGARRARVVGRHEGRELHQGHGHPQGGRQLASAQSTSVRRAGPRGPALQILSRPSGGWSAGDDGERAMHAAEVMPREIAQEHVVARLEIDLEASVGAGCDVFDLVDRRDLLRLPHRPFRRPSSAGRRP